MGASQQCVRVVGSTILVIAAFFIAEARAQGQQAIDRVELTFELLDLNSFELITGSTGQPVEVVFTFDGTTESGERFDEISINGGDITRVTPSGSDFLLRDPDVGVFSIDDPTRQPSVGFFDGDPRTGPTDFFDIFQGVPPGIPADTPNGSQADYDAAKLAFPDGATLTDIDYVAADFGGTAFAPGQTVDEAIRQFNDFANLQALAVIQFAGLNESQGALPIPANSTSALYGLNLTSFEISEVPLPAAVWLFLGALGSLAVARRFPRRAA